MSQNFVPEMHDLGKLAISAISGPHHDFAPIRQRPDLPDNATWRGIVYHMGAAPKEARDWQLPPLSDMADPATRRQVFLLMLADHLAATTGRALGEERLKTTTRGVHRLWHPSSLPLADDVPEPIHDDATLQDALHFVAQDYASPTPFWQRYGASLQAKAAMG